MPFKGIINVYSETETKFLSTQCGQKCRGIEAYCTFSNHCTLSGEAFIKIVVKKNKNGSCFAAA
jgi:hypothetical protein